MNKILLSGLLLAIANANAACPLGSVHCAYSKEPFKNAQGNYVRAVWPETGFEFQACFPYGAALMIDNNFILSQGVSTGSHHWQLSVCKDADCHQTKPLGTDNFALAESQQQYTATPASYRFKLKGYYPAVTCHSSQALFKLRP